MNLELMFFGSNNCPNCNIIKKLFDLNGIQYQFIDASDDEMQEMCDLFDVEELPNIQLVDVENKKIIETWIWSDGIPSVNLSSDNPFQELVNQIKQLTSIR